MQKKALERWLHGANVSSAVEANGKLYYSMSICCDILKIMADSLQQGKSGESDT